MYISSPARCYVQRSRCDFFLYLHKPRKATQQQIQRGGVATVCLNKRLKIGPIRMRTKPETFEYIATKIQYRTPSWRVINVYRLGGEGHRQLLCGVERLDQKSAVCSRGNPLSWRFERTSQQKILSSPALHCSSYPLPFLGSRSPLF